MKNKNPSVLCTLRREKNLTQSELAEKLGVSRSIVASWETGARQPSTQHAESLSRFFGVSADYLRGNSGQKYNINTSGSFEFDLTRLNSQGIDMIKKLYDLLINSNNYRNK